jgi:hypothetical protein
VNFGTTGNGGHSAAASGSDDVMRVVQTLMAAQVISHNNLGDGAASRSKAAEPDEETPFAVAPERNAVRPTATITPRQPKG